MIRAGDAIPNGWFYDGEQNLYHDGVGNFFVNGKWYARPDLLAAQPHLPPAPTLADRARMEAQRLSTPWPTYREAWKEATALKSFSRRWAKFGLLPTYGLMALIAATMSDAQTIGDQAPFPMFVPQMWLILAVLLAYPFSFWKVYHQALQRRDSHKAAAFAVVSYGAVAVGVHAARVHGENQATWN